MKHVPVNQAIQGILDLKAFLQDPEVDALMKEYIRITKEYNEMVDRWQGKEKIEDMEAEAARSREEARRLLGEAQTGLADAEDSAVGTIAEANEKAGEIVSQATTKASTIESDARIIRQAALDLESSVEAREKAVKGTEADTARLHREAESSKAANVADAVRIAKEQGFIPVKSEVGVSLQDH